MRAVSIFTRWGARALLVACVALSGCHTARDGVEGDSSRPAPDTVDVHKAPPQLLQVDILWVLDNSTAMCQELLSLTRVFEQFTSKLTAATNIDIRTAVVSMDGYGGGGVFNSTAATNFPPACSETRVHPCLGNQDCEKKFGPGWECKSYSADDLYNMNRSINSYCVYRCQTSGDCCGAFCYKEECGSDQSCLLMQCDGAPTDKCSFECRNPGQGTSGSGCLQPPETGDCPPSVPSVLGMNTLDLFKCIATIGSQQAYTANIEQGLKAAWLALDPEGKNAAQAAGFLRPDAHLLIVFITNNDDCSVHENFASPNYTCETDDNCLGGVGRCETDVYFSQKMGKQIKLCEGLIKKDYYSVCSMLGDFKGDAHHSCAYDLDCLDCESDEECDDGWYCKQGKKCRPAIYSLSNIATYQTPPGTPIHSLSPVADFHARFKSLKTDESKVLVAAIVGDGIPVGPGGKTGEPEQDSLISTACLENEKLTKCQEWVAANQTISKECQDDPKSTGCEVFFELKRECIRACYLASMGDPQNPTVAKATYICASELGKFDYGSRYFQLTEMFGANGIAANICNEGGISSALDLVAERLLTIATQ